MKESFTLQKITEHLTLKKSYGINTISIDEVLTLINENKPVEDSINNLEKTYDVNKQNSETYLELFRSVITIGINTSKTLMLINGGAAIALLTFLGNIWLSDRDGRSVIFLTNSLSQFAHGVLSSAVCVCLTYLCQLIYATYFFENNKSINTITKILNISAIISGGFSLYYFYSGLEWAASQFIS